jgi:hypothetical protein
LAESKSIAGERLTRVVKRGKIKVGRDDGIRM